MHKKPSKYLIIILLALPKIILGQQLQTNKYPVRFSQYYNCFSIVNPAGSAVSEDYNVTLSDKQLLGDFSQVSTYLLCASTKIANRNSRRNASYSSAGILVSNDREGKYLNRTRFYVSYAWHGSITTKCKISGGFHLGAMNYSVKGTPLSGDGSDIAPDGVVGIWIYSDIFHLGGSYGQMFNSKIQPLDEIAVLSPYLNIDGSLKVKLTDKILVVPSVSSRVTVNEKDILTDVTLKLTYSSKFSIVAGIHENYRMINSVELLNIFEGDFPLDLYISYGYPLTRKGINVKFMEFGITMRY